MTTQGVIKNSGLDFLLEIGTEEIPHWMIPGAVAQLEKLDLFGAAPKVDATPRRLVVRAAGLPDMTSSVTQLVQGPAASAGEKATAGFAKKQGVNVSDLQQQNGKYVYLKEIKGQPVRELLAASLPAAILGLQWPKTMFWEPSGARFIRPIRWIVALLGDQVIPFEIAGVKSGNVTKGHRKLGSSSIPVTFANYESELRRNFVILSSNERRSKIEKEIGALGAKPDAGLLETLTFITEYPTAIRGDFDPAYLELPAEVLVMVMRHHQKYFSVESAPNRLAPHFVAVMNTSGDPDGLVKRGNERVLKARFNDARFFWDVDMKRPLFKRFHGGDLDRVTFHARLGSYGDKIARIYKLVESLGGNEYALRAAQLCKSDLTTEMVKEFTDLQGIIGGLYAKAQGSAPQVWQAICDHYKPLNMEDSIPSTLEGQILAIADKLDTLRECFRIGLVPTGSKDPFALRRAAQGVVKILVDGKLDYKFEELFDGDLRDFMLDRIQHYFREIRGYKYDEVNAVLAAGVGPLTYVDARLVALAAVRTTDNFESLASSFKRIKNILKQANFTNGTLDQNQLIEEAEKALYSETKRVSAAFRSSDDYETALITIASLRPTVDKFFDEVMVNAPGEATRSNRLALLSWVLHEFSTIADFSEIVVSGDNNK